jgi:hypothetical protein
MFIFIDESGRTDLRSKQHYLVVAFALMKNREFAESLIFQIKDTCKAKGKPIKVREVHYHDLEPLQREVAVQVINSKYRNFYVCFFDVDKSPGSLVSGKFELEIQKGMIHSLLHSLDSKMLRESEVVKVIMDKKLPKFLQTAIRTELREHLKTKKGVYVDTATSSSERGIQVADVIAGAFRAKLLKKSDLFQVDLTHIFQITVPNPGVYKAEKVK